MSNFELSYNPEQNYWMGKFQAMAGPCEIFVDTDEKSLAYEAIRIAQTEAKRIEYKFSRYRQDNIVFQINQSHGNSIEVDAETVNLLNYAQECYDLSEGLFDITSGVLRKAWNFDGSDNLPDNGKVQQILDNVGWHKVKWKSPFITLQEGMQIDFGGIGKEYAVDRTALLIANQTGLKNVLVNYGGDVCALAPRRNKSAWEIGLQNPKEEANIIAAKIELFHGAIATSGDLHKFLIKDGIRYGHILNPKTGWPSLNAPRQVTVISKTCIEAGILSTLAILQGQQAESFLEAQELEYRVIR